VGPKAVLDVVVKRKIPSPRRESKDRTSIVQPVAQRYHGSHDDDDDDDLLHDILIDFCIYILLLKLVGLFQFKINYKATNHLITGISSLGGAGEDLPISKILPIQDDATRKRKPTR
jgi:hypothetical protein